MPVNLFVKAVNKILIPSTDEDKAKLEKFEEGKAIKCALTVPRSNPHHNLVMAAIEEAFKNWPETHEQQFDTKDELRGWLLCKAGHCFKVTLELDSEEYAALAAQSLAEFIQQADGFRRIFFKSHKSKVAVFAPQSIKFDELDQKEFNKISQEISDILSAEINMSLDDFKKEAGKAA